MANPKILSKNRYILKGDIEELLGRECKEVSFEEVEDKILQMYHDGEKYIIFFGTISDITFVRVRGKGFDIEQFIWNDEPGIMMSLKL